jgi:muramoyltetrapeptide carboxypeptidase
VHHYAAKYNYPIAFGMPIGHITDNRAIIIGAETQLVVDENQTKLLV